MAIEPRRNAVEYLERLIEEAAGSARKTRRLAERILHELTGAAQARVAPAARRRSDEEGLESDAESGWRLAA